MLPEWTKTARPSPLKELFSRRKRLWNLHIFRKIFLPSRRQLRLNTRFQKRQPLLRILQLWQTSLLKTEWSSQSLLKMEKLLWSTQFLLRQLSLMWRHQRSGTRLMASSELPIILTMLVELHLQDVISRPLMVLYSTLTARKSANSILQECRLQTRPISFW